MKRIFLLRTCAIVATAALAACGGHGSGSSTLPVPRTSEHSNVSLTVTRAAQRSSATSVRHPQDIPASALSVSAIVYVGSAATGTPADTACVNFTAGSSQATLSVNAPYGTDTIVISSWSGACTASGGAGTTGSGSVLTTFTGTGNINAPSGTVSGIFNAGNPVVLGVVLPPATNTPVSVSFRSIGPVYPAAGTYIGASGKLQSFALDQNNPATMYVAGGYGSGGWEVDTDAGIYRTTDGGTTWTPVDNGLTDTTVNDLYMDQSNPSVLLAATQYGGIFRTSDGGNTWVNVSGSLTQSFLGSQVTHFASLGSNIYAASAVGVLVSKDDGQTWSVSLTTPSFGAVTAVAAGGGLLYAGTNGEGFFVYQNGTWTQRTSLPPDSVYGATQVNQIAVDQTTPTTVYATRGGLSPQLSWAATGILYASTDGGQTWHLPVMPTNWYGSQMVAMSAVTPHKVYTGAEFAQAYSTDGGVTWTRDQSDGDQRGLYVFANGTQDSCYTPSDQGVFYFPSCGSSTGEKNITQGISDSYVTNAAVQGPTIMAMLQDFSPAVSFDGGATWSSPGGFWEDGGAAIDPYATQYCYAADISGYGYSSDGCHTFTIDASVPASENMYDWTFDPATPANVFAKILTNGKWTEVKSTDYGKTYTPVSWPMGINTLFIDPQNDRHIVVEGTDTSGNAAHFVTLDGGTTWTTAAGGNFASGVTQMDPQNGDIIIGISGTSIYRSTNGGFSYTATPFTGIPGTVRQSVRKVHQTHFDSPIMLRRERHAGETDPTYQGGASVNLAIDDHGTVPFLALNFGGAIYVSTDWGVDWQRVKAGVISTHVNGVEFDGGNLYVTTVGQGILKAGPLQ